MARTTNSMALRLWDQLGDRYDNQQLSGNFAKIDAHDHTPGRGVQIPGAGIQDGSVTLAKLVTGVGVSPGVIQIYGGDTAPGGYLFCDGSSYNQVSYASLYSVIGTRFGTAGAGTFLVPDLRGRTPVGVGAGAGLTARLLAALFGEEAHALTLAELASHAHTVTDPGHAHGVTDAGHAHALNDPGHAHGTTNHMVNFNLAPTYVAGGTQGISDGGTGTLAATTGASVTAAATGLGVNTTGTGVSVNSSGSGTGHNNMQPSLGLNFIIKT